jgi:hypothetical protein
MQEPIRSKAEEVLSRRHSVNCEPGAMPSHALAKLGHGEGSEVVEWDVPNNMTETPEAATTRGRRFTYSADAELLSGHLSRPVDLICERQSRVSLSDERGGHLVRDMKRYSADGLISFQSGYTSVSGSYSEEHAWVTLATSVLEDLNVLDVITAERVVAQVFTEHQYNDSVPKVTFLGTRFENLQVGGYAVQVELDLGICGDKPEDGRSYLEDRSFLNRIRHQSMSIVTADDLPRDLREKYDSKIAYIDVLRKRANGHDERGVHELLECSLIKSIAPIPIPGVRTIGNLILIPDFGFVSLADVEVGVISTEGLVTPKRLEFSLKMLQIRMGCIAHGTIVAAGVSLSGTKEGGPGTAERALASSNLSKDDDGWQSASTAEGSKEPEERPKQETKLGRFTDITLLEGHIYRGDPHSAIPAPSVGAAGGSAKPPAPYSVASKPAPRREMPGRFLVDNVHFTLTGQSVLGPDRAYELLFWVHVKQQKEAVLAGASAALGLPISEISVKSEGPYPLQRGSRLSVRMKIAGVTCLDSHKWIMWTGEIGSTAFVVEVPANASEGTYAGSASIRLNGCEIAKMSFVLRVGPPRLDHGEIPSQTAVHRKAFASYASQDRVEVLNRIQGMEAAYKGLRVFVDVAALRSGQKWEQELSQRVSDADVFYLFWCRHASKSEWVSKEWHWALQAKGENFIDPIPLETPELAPPPKELAAKHFNDPLLASIAAAGGGHSHDTAP